MKKLILILCLLLLPVMAWGYSYTGYFDNNSVWHTQDGSVWTLDNGDPATLDETPGYLKYLGTVDADAYSFTQMTDANGVTYTVWDWSIFGGSWNSTEPEAIAYLVHYGCCHEDTWQLYTGDPATWGYYTNYVNDYDPACDISFYARNEVPEPATLLLVGMGLLGLAGVVPVRKED